MAKSPPSAPRDARRSLRLAMRLHRAMADLLRTVFVCGWLAIVVSCVCGAIRGEMVREVAAFHIAVAVVNLFALLLARGTSLRVAHWRRVCGEADGRQASGRLPAEE